jgi:hypothetical protein
LEGADPHVAEEVEEQVQSEMAEDIDVLSSIPQPARNVCRRPLNENH